MDGNARWATERGVPVLEGHRRGAQTLKQTVKDAVALDLLELTVYAFSTENWTRPRAEVEGLMAMFAELIESETPELDEEGVRMRFIGRREDVSRELQERMSWAERVTAGNERMVLFVAFNYGGRAEIVDAAERYGCGGEDEFAQLLYAPEMTDPDLLIRTSGERRLSNYLLWQCAYSELVFSEKLWPDFERADLAAALDDYEARERRFGAR
jgi:undecaprenyl diphosphate synthase